MKIEFYCPNHLKDERWDLPDSYRYFKGELECAPPPGEKPHTLKAWFIRGMLVEVEPEEVKSV
jgi:hypothetical protein